MKRRELLGLLGGAAIWPLSASGQRSMPVIGFLANGSFASNQPQLSAFREGMDLNGFADGRNVAVEYRWAEGHDDLLPGMATELARQDAAVIVAGGSEKAVKAAQRATRTIPIIFVSGSDPVRSGFVTNPDHPDGNITGFSLAAPELLAKRFEVLHKIAPQVSTFAALVNPDNPNIEVQLRYLTDSTRRTGIAVQVVNASKESDLGPAFDEIAQRRVAGLVVANDGFLNSQGDLLIAQTTRFAIAAAFGNQELVTAGGLVSYGPSSIDAYRQAGTYAGRILNGEKPADLPVQNPIEFELAINLKTARSLGLNIPPALLATADQVIE
jgi:putative tryptophan/tyrosine transport system substrate-binding protein